MGWGDGWGLGWVGDDGRGLLANGLDSSASLGVTFVGVGATGGW